VPEIRFLADLGAIVVGERVIKLTRKQWALFALLWRHRNSGAVVTRLMLSNALYASDLDGGADPKIIDVYIWDIRRRLAGTSIDIHTMWGRGYYLMTKPAPARRAVAEQSVGAAP